MAAVAAYTVAVSVLAWSSHTPPQLAPHRSGQYVMASMLHSLDVLHDEDIANELDAVPVFAVLLPQDSKIYCGNDDSAMAYTHLGDASKVLAQLQQTYPETEFALHVIYLGATLQACGALTRSIPAPGDSVSALPNNVKLTLAGSPFEKKVAKRLLKHAAEECASPAVQMEMVKVVEEEQERWEGQEAEEDLTVPAVSDPKSASIVKRLDDIDIPLFHLGAFELVREAGSKSELWWPLCFHSDDVQELWSEVGRGEPLPPLRTIALRDVLQSLRSGAALPGQPQFCAPIESMNYLREQVRAVETAIQERAASASTTNPRSADLFGV